MVFGEVTGIVIKDNHTGFKKVQVRYSSDKIGQTLSLSDDDAGIMITVPYEYIQRLVKKAEGK